MAREGERRIVSVLVSDVVGSTSIGEQLGPERSKFLFDEIAGLMTREVERVGGTMAQLTGDGVLALFGAPVAHGDDAERAVRAALAIHDVLRTYAQDIEEAYGIALAARVAINTGHVVVPKDDAPADVLYNALGDTVNVAARLQAEAGAGGTALGESTAREVESLFALEPLGELLLKGRTDPVAAFRVVGTRPTVAPHQTPLVGRETELASLVEALADLEDGRGAIFSLTGEPGIGKSRLVAEARGSAPDTLFLVGNTSSYAEGFPYWPVRDLLRSWLALGVDDTDARVRLELKTALEGVLGDGAADAYPFLASVLGVTLPGPDGERLRGLTPDSVQRQISDAMVTLVTELARERPLCLVFEDLHWADPSTLALLEEMFPLAESEAVELLLLYRSERDHASWRLGELARQRYPHRYREVELHALPAEASRSLAAGAAGAELPESVAELLAVRSGGNPFFLEEALRDLVERGALRRLNAHWELAVADADLDVPLLVQEALQARLDRLQPGTREVAAVAAVIGRSFALPLLERLTDPAGLPAALTELQRLDLVVEERRRPRPEYRFRHGLVQEVAYGGMLEDRRRHLHRRTAEALEELHSENVEEVAGLLAHHLDAAGETARAAERYDLAGDLARAQYANEEALGYYARAVELYDGSGDEHAARETLLKIGIGHHMAFDFPRAAAAYDEAMRRRPRRPLSPAPTARLSCPLPRPESIVPGIAYSSWGWWLAQHLYRGLVRIDRAHNVFPEVAERFSVSDDGLRYTFGLRGDVHWHDGRPVTAHDFISTWQAIRDRCTQTAFLLDPIAEATAVDERRLEIRLHGPSNTLLYILGQPCSFPWPSHSDGVPDPERDGALVGNGPFTLASWGDAGCRLLAAPGWPLPRGNVGELDIVFGTGDTAFSAWSEGRYDFGSGDNERVLSARQPSDVLESVIGVGVAYIGFDASSPPFDDARVRRAVGHCLDRDRLQQASGHLSDAAHGGLLPPPMPGHVHDVGLAHDIERARTLLAEAGHPGGTGIPEVTMMDLDSTTDAWTAEFARQLETIGITVRSHRSPTHLHDERAKREGHLFSWGWVADCPDPSTVFEPLLATYPRLYRDDALLELLDRARRTVDRDARLELFSEADRLVVAEHASMLPFAYAREVLLRKPWVSGLWIDGYVGGCVDEVVVDEALRR